MGARIIVSSTDGTIQPQNSGVVLTDADGSFEVTLYADNFREREAEGTVTIQPPSGATLPDTVVAVLLRTGPSDPTTETSLVYE